MCFVSGNFSRSGHPGGFGHRLNSNRGLRRNVPKLTQRSQVSIRTTFHDTWSHLLVTPAKMLNFRQVVRSRIPADQYGGGLGNREHYDRFANDRSIDR